MHDPHEALSTAAVVGTSMLAIGGVGAVLRYATAKGVRIPVLLAGSTGAGLLVAHGLEAPILGAEIFSVAGLAIVASSAVALTWLSLPSRRLSRAGA